MSGTKRALAVWPESGRQQRARAIVLHLAQADELGIALRMRLLAALGELDEDLPAGFELAVVDAEVGTVEQAHDLLLGPRDSRETARDVVAQARAAALLAPLLDRP